MSKKPKKPTGAQKAEAARLMEEEHTRTAQKARDKIRDDAAKLAGDAEREAVHSMEKPAGPVSPKRKGWFG